MIIRRAVSAPGSAGQRTIDPVHGPGQPGSIPAEGSHAARRAGRRAVARARGRRQTAMSGERSGQELVVVGVDGSAESVRALGWAARYATATGARVQAVRAWHYPDVAGQAPVGIAPDPVHHESEAQQLAMLDEAITKAYSGHPGPAAESRLGYGH